MPTPLYPHTTRPVSAAEIVRAARARLSGGRGTYDPVAAAALGALAGENGVSGRMLLHEEKSDAAPPYAVVLQRRPAGGSVAGAIGERHVVVIVRLECRASRAGWDAWHDVMHQHVHAVLQGFWPEGLQTAEVRSGFAKVRAADTPLFDAEDDTRYSASAYALSAVPRANS